MPPQPPSYYLAAKKRMKRGMHDRVIQAREKSFTSIDPNTPRVQRQPGAPMGPRHPGFASAAPGARPVDRGPVRNGGVQAPVQVKQHTRAPVGFGRPQTSANRTLSSGLDHRNAVLRGLARGAAKVGSDNPAALYGAIAKDRKRRRRLNV